MAAATDASCQPVSLVDDDVAIGLGLMDDVVCQRFDEEGRPRGIGHPARAVEREQSFGFGCRDSAVFVERTTHSGDVAVTNASTRTDLVDCNAIQDTHSASPRTVTTT